jgi:hypothetical protein
MRSSSGGRSATEAGSVRIINPSGHGTPALTAANSAPRVLAAKTGTDRTQDQEQRPKEWAPIRGGLPKNGTARPRLPIIGRHRPEPVKGKPALDGTRTARARRPHAPLNRAGDHGTGDR